MLDFTLEIDIEKVKKRLKELRETAHKSVKGTINEFDALDAAVLRLSSNMQRVGDKADLGGLEKKIKQAQRLLGEMDKAAIPEGATQKATERARRLTEAINQANDALERTERVGRSSSRGFNALQHEIQQVARELPALAYGPQVFFSALSNNIPMLADQIAQTRKELGGFKPVLKQIISSVISWQTLLVAGVTIFTMYGKEITQWVGSLFKGRKALDEMAAAHKAFNDTMRKGAIDAQGEVTKFRLLYKTATDTATAMERRTKAVDEIRKLYPSYLQGLSDEQILIGKAKGAYEEITASIYQTAKAKAALSKITELEELGLAVGLAPDEYKNRAEEAKRERERLQKEQVASQRTTGKIYTDNGELDDLYNFEGRIIQQQKKEQAAFSDWIDTQGDKFEWIKAQGIKTFDELNAYIATTTQALAPIATNALFDPEEEARAAQQAAEQRKRTEAEVVKELNNIKVEAQQAEIEAMPEGLPKQLAQIKFEYEQKKAAIAEGEKELIAKRREAGGSGLTEQEKAYIAQLRDAVERSYQMQVAEINKKAADEATKATEEATKAELSAMLGFLKEYGTIQQQKYAIAEEYNRKIAASTSEWEKQTLTKEREAALAKVSATAIKEQIDWAVVFSELGGMFKGVVQPTIDALRGYIATDEFKSLQSSDQQAIVDAYNKMLGEGDQTANFKDLGVAVNAYQVELQRMTDLTHEEAFSYEVLADAQKEYDRALKYGTDAEKQAAEQWLNTAKESANEVSEQVQVHGKALEEAQRNVSNTANILSSSMHNISGGLQKMKSDSLKSIYEGFGDVAKGISQRGGKVGDAFDKVAKAMDSVPIVGEILGLVDVFKDGVTDFLTSIIDTMFGAINNIINELLSGKIVASVAKSIGAGVGRWINAISFGAFDNWNGSNGKQVQAVTERLTLSNEYLRSSIDALKTSIDKTAGMQAVEAYQKAVEYQKQVIENTGDILGAQMGYHGSHHSNNYYIDKALKGTDWERISELVGERITKASQLWNLSPEQLKALQGGDYELFQKIATAGYYDKSKYLNDYIELADTIDEMTDKLNETLTGTSFDQLRDGFLNTLMDMDASAKDFSEDFAEYMMKSMLSAKIADQFEGELEKWYEKWASFAESGGGLDQAEIDALRQGYDEITQRMIEARDEIAQITGYGSSADEQKASARGFNSMTQEVGNELNGRFTDIQGKVTDIREYVLNAVELNRQGVNMATDIRDIAIQIRGDVAEIRDFTEVLPSMRDAIKAMDKTMKERL